MAKTLSVKDGALFLGGEPFRLMAGSIHYFRVPEAYWEDRILKMKAMGCNTLETYTAWNLHEPEQGEFDFEGMLDLVKFVNIAAQHDMYVIVRFSPYICAEWENGGIPYWLLKDKNIRVRTRDPKFMAAVKSYYDEILKRIKPLFATNGGPIIATQLENEYGCTNDDKAYMQEHYDYLTGNGVDIPMFSCTWVQDRAMKNSFLPGTILASNFREGAEEKFEKMRAMDPDNPLVVTEFWSGWFSPWGNKRERPPATAEEIAGDMDAVLKAGGHPIIFVFHGGTNFAFMNGANVRTDYAHFTITSYDYEAPLSECGGYTETYHALKEVCKKHGFETFNYESKIKAPVAYDAIEVKEASKLLPSLDNLTTPIKSPYILSMEEAGQDYGYTLYRTEMVGPFPAQKISMDELHDRAHIFIDGKYFETVQRDAGRFVGETKKELTLTADSAVLEILVENQGRANFPPFDYDYKGITKSVILGDCFVLSNWDIYTLPMKDVSGLNWTAPYADEHSPGFFKAQLHLDEVRDTYIYPKEWRKGFIMVNGFNIGRYWNIGPQYSLYCPAPFLKEGENEIILFEEEKPGKTIHFSEKLVMDY